MINTREMESLDFTSLLARDKARHERNYRNAALRQKVVICCHQAAQNKALQRTFLFSSHKTDSSDAKYGQFTPFVSRMQEKPGFEMLQMRAHFTVFTLYWF